jgi:PAS domain S-box-containing protein
MSLLSHLFIPVLIAILPAVAFGIFDEFDARSTAGASVKVEAARLRDTIQAEQTRVFDGIRQVASLVAASAAVRDGDARGCQAFLDRSAVLLPPEQIISVTDRSGAVICSSRADQVGRPLGSRFDLMAALKTDRFLAGDYIRMGASGAALPSAMRYHGSDGQVRGIVAVMLDVAWWKTDRSFAKLPENVSLTVADRSGTILARRPDPGDPSGRSAVGRTLENFTGAGPQADSSVIQATVQPSASPQGLFIGIGIDPRDIQAGLDEATRRRVLFVAGGLAAALLAAGFLGHRFIRRPVSALVEAAESWGTGDYRARVGLPDDRSEFGVLARAFDAMAEALERREKERDVAEDTARKMAVVLESSTDGICEIDRDWCISFINSRASAFIGPGRDAIGTPLFEAFPEASGSLVQRECERAMAENVPVSFEEYFGAHDLWLSVRAFPVSSGLMICFQDVTARRRADQHGERTEAHHRAIVATAPEGMVVIDEHGVIQSFNPAAERLFGYDPGEVVGLNVTVLMPERDRAVHDGYIWNYRHGADRNVIGKGRQLEGRRKDGTIFELELSVAEWRDGRQRFFTGFMRDASARREAGDALKSARDEAAAARAEADRAALSKSRFLAAASHDLRQPVQSLLFLSAALAEGLRGHPMLPLAGSIDQATDALKRLLDGLLDISRLDAGTITPKATLFSADTLIDKLGAEYAQRAERQGVSLRVVGCSSRVHSDPVLLERILRNLIENALRHTTHGRILIGCRRISGALRIDVLDTGTGVPPNTFAQDTSAPDTFAPDTFAQCPDRGQEAGLGLAIVRRLAALLGHRVSALYSPGRGCRYSVEVPLASLSAPERSPSAISVEESARPETRGLIVILDDEAIILLGLGVLLESWNYQVLSAMSLDEAVQQVADETRTPDLIIADYRLADGNTGPEAIDAIREISDPRIPGIVLTGDTAPGILERVGKRGFGILHKPVAADDLHRIVLDYIELRNRARQMPTSTAALTM